MSEPKDKWEEMVKESKDAIEDFNDFLVDKAIIWADAELFILNAKISELEKDARRYNWLTSRYFSNLEPTLAMEASRNTDEMSAAIDAAIDAQFATGGA